jgi:hypothetical protein
LGLDVYPGLLDGAFQAVYDGCAGHVAPWSSSIRKVLVDGKWRDTMPRTEWEGPTEAELKVESAAGVESGSSAALEARTRSTATPSRG